MSSPSDAKHAETQQHLRAWHVPLRSREEIHLDTAIEKASRAQLDQILRQLCAHSQTATEMTMSHLAREHEKADAPKQTTLRSILKKSGSFKPSSQSTSVEPTTSASTETPPSSQTQSQGIGKRKATTTSHLARKHEKADAPKQTTLRSILKKPATENTVNRLARQHEKADAPKQTTLRSILKRPESFKPSFQSTPVGPTSASNATRPSSQMQSQGNGKRKATTQCRNCGLEYNAANTDPLACTYHPGKREVNPDHEVWDDFDPDVLGDAWTLMEYEEFMSGFQWSCCKVDLDKRGCMLGKHQAAPVGEWKRARR